MKYEKCCGAAVYTIRDGELYFLVEQMKAGHRSIPKGHVEGSETEEETARREIREETNLEVRLDPVFRHEISYPHGEGVEKHVVLFAAEALTEELKNQENEVTGLEWLRYDRAIEAVTQDEYRQVLTHAAVYLGIRYSLDIGRRCVIPPGPYADILYREHAVDIHSHTIVGVDDGAQTMKEAVELLRLDREEGIQTVFATPHYGKKNGYAPHKQAVYLGFDQLSKAAKEAVPGIELCLGTEWYCSEDIVERIRRREAWPMMNTDWYMVEFLEYGETWEPAEDMLRRLKKMKDNGIRTILAHPERYQAIQQDWDLAKRICDLGVRLQVNAYDLCLNQNENTRSLAQWMATEGLISFLGSDMHGTRPGKRTPKMKEGIRWLYENVERHCANDIVRRNAERFLGVEKLIRSVFRRG